MILNFEKYNLNESSSFSMFNLNKEQLKTIHRGFGIAYDAKITKLEISRNNILDLANYLEFIISDYLVIIEFDKDDIYILKNREDNNQAKYSYYLSKDNKFYEYSYNLATFLKHYLQLEDFSIEHINFYQVKSEYKDKSIEEKKREIYDTINNMLDLYYKPLFTKFYQEYFLFIRKLIKENIDSVENFDSDEYNYHEDLMNDLKNVIRYKNNYKASLDNEFIKRSLAIEYKNANDEDCDQDEYSLFDFYNLIIDKPYEVVSKIAKHIFKNNNSQLKIYRYKYYDILLQKDPTKWKDLKLKIYDKKLKQKWEHLDNANNFDLI